MKKISLIIPASIAIVTSIGCYSKVYTVNFKNYDGTVLQTLKVKSGAKAKYTGETPTRAPDEQYTYTFSGWDNDITKSIKANTNFTAQFASNLNKFTVTFNTRGGTTTEPLEPKTVEFGKTVSRPDQAHTPTKDTFTFVDWYTENYQRFDFSTPIKSDLVLYAGWGHTVTFSGTTEEYPVQIVPTGWYASNPGIPASSDPDTKICYGWKIDDGSTSAFEFDETPVTTNLTLIPAEAAINLRIEGEHNININSPSTTLHAYANIDDSGEVEVLPSTHQLVWKVVSGYENIISIDSNGKISVPSNSVGGEAYILAYIDMGEGNYYYGIHEVEVASFSYINMDSFKNNEVKAANGNITGKLVIPSRYWDTGTNSWVEREKQVIDSGFNGCRQLTSVVIPENITAIGKEAFKNIELMPPYGAAGNIKNITFRGTSNVRVIGIEAFDGNKISSIKIPTSVVNIGNGAFYNCPLTSVTFEDQTNTQWKLTPSNTESATKKDVTIDIKNYTDQQLAKGFTVYSWDDVTYGKGDFNWAKLP